jgi:hypothetical protein
MSVNAQRTGLIAERVSLSSSVGRLNCRRRRPITHLPR